MSRLVNIDRELIQKLRADRAWAREDLANAANLAVRTITRIETTGRASLKTVRELARVFGVDAPQLVGSAAVEAKSEKSSATTRLLAKVNMHITAAEKTLASDLTEQILSDELIADLDKELEAHFGSMRGPGAVAQRTRLEPSIRNWSPKKHWWPAYIASLKSYQILLEQETE